jgi:deoxyribonucleoside regulator
MPIEGSQNNTSETRLLADERFLRKIAYAYYEDGYSQEAIADMEFCSRQTISKALQKARERGIVRIFVVPDTRVGYLRNLSRDVRIHLGLDDVVLVVGRSLKDLSEGVVQEDVVIEIATAAAEYLDQLLTDTDTLAVSGGKQFMRNVVRYLKPTKNLPHLNVVATLGFVEAHAGDGDANLVAYDIARAYGAQHTWFSAPAISREDWHIPEIRKFPLLKEACELMENASVLMTGLWTPHSNSEVIMEGILTREELELIDSYNPVVDINHWVFDANGCCINTMLNPPPYFLSGLRVHELKDQIKRVGTRSILVAGGSMAFIPAIRAALKAGVANILITDHVTAQYLMEFE